MTANVDEAELQRIARQRRFDPRTLEIARRLFIEGDRPKLLAAEYGLILQRIYAIRKAVLDLALPAGQAEVTLRGPVEAVEAAQRAFERYNERVQADGAVHRPLKPPFSGTSGLRPPAQKPDAGRQSGVPSDSGFG